MVLKIRLARFGKKHAPVYNIVVSHAHKARGSRPKEVIGTYDPIPKPPEDGEGKPYKDINLDVARARYWVGVGAQPSDPVWRLLSMFGIIEPQWSIAKVPVLKQVGQMREAAYVRSHKPKIIPEEGGQASTKSASKA